jgi:hypothetical protein
MISFANDACKAVNRDVLFPQARWDITIIPNQATYQISPVVITTDAVFVNGQLCPRTTKKIMSGQQIGVNDSSGTMLPTATGVEIPGGVTGQFAPAWISAAPSIFPYQGIGAAGPGSPWYGGFAPEYYWDGGYLGIQPAPGGAGTITMYGVPVVPDLVLLTDATYFPINFVNAIVWKMCEYAKFSDDSDKAAEARNYAAGEYEKEMRNLRTWNRRRTGDDARAPKVRTNRSFYIKGNHKAYGYTGEWE